MNNVSMEYVTCAAYFAHAALAVKNAGDQATSDKFARFYESTMALGLAAAQAGRSEEMALKVTTARLNMVMDNMQNEIENNYSNFALLYEQYHKRCEYVLNNTDEFLEEWTKKARGN